MNEILHDDIYDVFMKIAMIAEAHQIELEGFAFYHPLSRYITDIDGRIIRLSGNRTERRKLRAIELDPVIMIRMTILERLQNLRTIVIMICDFLLPEKRNLLFLLIACHIISSVVKISPQSFLRFPDDQKDIPEWNPHRIPLSADGILPHPPLPQCSI